MIMVFLGYVEFLTLRLVIWLTEKFQGFQFWRRLFLDFKHIWVWRSFWINTSLIHLQIFSRNLAEPGIKSSEEKSFQMCIPVTLKQRSKVLPQSWYICMFFWLIKYLSQIWYIPFNSFPKTDFSIFFPSKPIKKSIGPLHRTF